MRRGHCMTRHEDSDTIRHEEDTLEDWIRATFVDAMRSPCLHSKLQLAMYEARNVTSQMQRMTRTLHRQSILHSIVSKMLTLS